MLQGQNNQVEMDIGDIIIEYDLNSYQVKMTIVKCAKVRQK